MYAHAHKQTWTWTHDTSTGTMTHACTVATCMSLENKQVHIYIYYTGVYPHIYQRCVDYMFMFMCIYIYILYSDLSFQMKSTCKVISSGSILFASFSCGDMRLC